VEEEEYDFPLALPEELREAVRGKLREIGYDGQKKLLLYNVGAAWQTKRWSVEAWVRLVEMLKNRNFISLILWGNEEEKELGAEIREKTDIPLSPYLALKEVMALIKESALLISGDTFALQVACAFSRPVVGIFGPTNPRRNGPFRAGDRVAFHEMECSYCYRKKCQSLECLNKITPEEVANLALQII
jgi:ADP-heptose:LPS heptosyltransferase